MPQLAQSTTLDNLKFFLSITNYFKLNTRTCVLAEKQLMVNPLKFTVKIITLSSFAVDVIMKSLRTMPPPNKVFCAAYDYARNADLSKGYCNLKRKLGVTMHFSKIIKQEQF